MRRLVEKQRHHCRADDGSEHTIIEYQEIIESQTMTGHHSVPGLKTLRDSRGRHCNFIDDDTFEIVETGQTVRKV